MIDMKTLDLRARQLEAKAEAQSKLLVMLTKALIATAPAASGLLSALQSAATYDGPVGAKKELARLAKAAAGASSGS